MRTLLDILVYYHLCVSVHIPAFLYYVCTVKGDLRSSSGAHPAEADICGWWTDIDPTRRLRY